MKTTAAGLLKDVNLTSPNEKNDTRKNKKEKKIKKQRQETDRKAETGRLLKQTAVVVSLNPRTSRSASLRQLYLDAKITKKK